MECQMPRGHPSPSQTATLALLAWAMPNRLRLENKDVLRVLRQWEVFGRSCLGPPLWWCGLTIGPQGLTMDRCRTRAEAGRKLGSKGQKKLLAPKTRESDDKQLFPFMHLSTIFVTHSIYRIPIRIFYEPASAASKEFQVFRHPFCVKKVFPNTISLENLGLIMFGDGGVHFQTGTGGEGVIIFVRNFDEIKAAITTLASIPMDGPAFLACAPRRGYYVCEVGHFQMANSGSVTPSLLGGAESPILGGANTLLPNGKKTKGRVKIKMEYIGNKLRRYTTFSKRKTGIMKKAFELSTLTGTQVMLLVASETGHVYAFATNKLKPMIASDAGRGLIQSCLNTPDEAVADVGACKTEFTFEPPSGCGGGSARKRKINETETLCVPTMVASSTLSTSPMNVEDYCDSDHDSDTNESPDTEEAKSPVPPAADPQLLQKTLKDALRAASLQRQNVMQKKPRYSGTPTSSSAGSSSANRNSSASRRQNGNAESGSSGNNVPDLSTLLPLMLQSISNGAAELRNSPKPTVNNNNIPDGDDNRILYQMPQGVVYASNGEPASSSSSSSAEQNGSTNNLFASNSNTESTSDNPLQQFLNGFPFGNMQMQQLLATAALAEAQAQLSSGDNKKHQYDSLNFD
uniref:Serum response factor homolog n=1 Tax=Panagrellus redivivus TaxID=6233 RepID=A0A7E4V548_PANRE